MVHCPLMHSFSSLLPAPNEVRGLKLGCSAVVFTAVKKTTHGWSLQMQEPQGAICFHSLARETVDARGAASALRQEKQHQVHWVCLQAAEQEHPHTWCCAWLGHGAELIPRDAVLLAVGTCGSQQPPPFPYPASRIFDLCCGKTFPFSCQAKSKDWALVGVNKWLCRELSQQ